MNKRERKSRLKDILTDARAYQLNFESHQEVLDGACEKINELYDYLDERCILPSNIDFEDMKTDLIREYFEEDVNLSDITNSIEELLGEVYDTICDMKEGDRRDEWEEFHGELEDMSNSFDLSYISDTEEMRTQLEDFIDRIENLLEM